MCLESSQTAEITVQLPFIALLQKVEIDVRTDGSFSQ